MPHITKLQLSALSTLLIRAAIGVVMLARDFLPGSSRSSGVQGSGVAATSTRALANFGGIYFAGSNNVTVVGGARQSVVVHADSNSGRQHRRVAAVRGSVAAGGPMSVLVSAASRHGATTEIAQAIGRALAERGWEVTVLPPEQVSGTSNYDAVILGSAVYFGQWLKPAADLARRVADELSTRTVWLFSSGPVGDPPKPANNTVDVSQIVTMTKAKGHQLLGGKLTKSQLNFRERAMAAALRVQDGDYRDWALIRQWATEVGDAIEASGGMTAV